MPKQAAGTGLAEDQIITGPAVPLTLERLSRLRWPRRQLPAAGALLMSRGEYLGPGDQQGQEIERREQEECGTAGGDRHDDRYGYRNDHGYARLGWIAHRRPGLRPGSTPRRHGVGQPGGQVGGERGQLPMGPRGECLAQPCIQLGFGQHALHERRLEHVDQILAIGMRRTQIATGHRVCRILVTRPCCHRYHPHLQNAKSVAQQRGQPLVGGYVSDAQLLPGRPGCRWVCNTHH